MAIVPVGKHKVMKGQTFKFAQFMSGEGQQSTAPLPQLEPRLQVEQTDMEENASPDASSPNTMQNMNTSPETNSGDVSLQSNPNNSVQKPDNQEKSGGESAIRDAWAKKMIEIGVPERQLDNLAKKLFSQEVDLSSGRVSGHFMIPGYTNENKINEKDAFAIARQMSQQFNLTAKVKFEGKNYRVDFFSMPQQEVLDGGTSFDEFHGEGTGTKKAAMVIGAMTFGEMLSARKEELFHELRKIAEGK